MKILYGVQGTGNGHISRARAMAQAFAEIPGLDVQFLFSGRAEKDYFDMALFGDYWTRRGLTFVSEAGQVNIWKTALRNSPYQLRKEVRALDVSGFDLVISDFEPVTAHAARRQGKMSLSISHQSAFSYDVPKQGQTLLDALIMRHFAPTEMKIGLHWYHFNEPILPPIIDITPQSVERNGAIVVYLPFEALDRVIDTLRHVDARFVCFHPACTAQRVVENMEIRPLSKQGFSEALHGCNGVIANGGFELPSEALSLGKKLLLKPLSGQFEQLSNVATLDTLGLASSMESLDIGVIREWLDDAESYRVQYPDVARALAGWVAEGDMTSLPALRESLWASVSYPEHVTDLLTDFLPTKGRKRAMLSMRLPTSSNRKLKAH